MSPGRYTMKPPVLSLSLLRQVLAFAGVGVIGFGVDASVLYIGIAVGLGLNIGRLVSYLCAVTATWALNRRFTFADSSEQASFSQWFRFGLSQLSGATVNLGAYYILVHNSTVAAAHPIIAVAIGSLLGMTLNFLVARYYVFRTRSRGDTLSRARRLT